MDAQLLCGSDLPTTPESMQCLDMACCQSVCAVLESPAKQLSHGKCMVALSLQLADWRFRQNMHKLEGRELSGLQGRPHSEHSTM